MASVRSAVFHRILCCGAVLFVLWSMGWNMADLLLAGEAVAEGFIVGNDCRSGWQAGKRREDMGEYLAQTSGWPKLVPTRKGVFALVRSNRYTGILGHIFIEADGFAPQCIRR